MTQDRGILSFGAYLPWRRLQRKAIASANTWFNPGLKGQAKGERTIANWDEDAITMGIEAARDGLAGFDRSRVTHAVLASTTHPFADRLNIGIAAGALGLADTVGAQDTGGTMRAGTSALIQALQGNGQTLVMAADKRQAKAASTQEMAYGDGAAAMLVGSGTPIAKLRAAHSHTVDFVHQYRMHDQSHDYAWEERWIRDEGYFKIVPAAVNAALQAAGVEASAVAHFCMPCTLSRVGAGVAKKVGIPDSAVRDNFAATCGDTGAAHALLMLAHALESARPGDIIVVAAFGQGCDALVLEATPAIAQRTSGGNVSAALARRNEDGNYMRYLTINGLVDVERGMRAEADKLTPQSTAYRNRDALLGLIGGKCRSCGTVQYPQQRYCVEPTCKALDSQDDHPFAESRAKVLSYTADQLTYSPDPPAWYGMVQFDEGGRMMADFTDVPAVDVGTPMRMAFRIKDVDAARGFQRYFWKAQPVVQAAPAQS
jgi:3-hydroxy-3-methylglutaryl CoA synthase